MPSASSGVPESSTQARPAKRLRALVVGSGYRVRNAFLPALNCLDSHIDIVGIHSRNRENAQMAGKPWGVQAIASLEELRPGDVDMVLVSVTVTNNLAVLRAAAHLAPGASLVLDTPCLGRISDLAHFAEYRRWAQIRAAEDFMNLPQFRLIGSLIDSGALGDIRAIQMSQVGYRYHALALLRSWLGFRSPTYARSKPVGEGSVDIKYRFPGGAICKVLEPYRKAEGWFAVAGTRGAIAGHPMGHGADEPLGPEATNAGKTGRLIRVEDSAGLVGFEIVGLDTTLSTEVPNLPRLREMGLEDDCEFNLLRIDGLSLIISSLWAPDLVNERYRLEDAMADLLVSAAARRLPWVMAPHTHTSNAVDLVGSAAMRFRQ